MVLSMIAAVGKNGELGKKGELIFHYKEDMDFFRQTTLGSTVIMGRKTFDSLPKALPKRRNIVITRDLSFSAEGVETAHSVQEALAMLGDEKAFIIGGAAVYEQFLPYADEIYLTEIDASCEDADTFFPAFNKNAYNKEVIQKLVIDGVTLVFCRYYR